MAEEYDTRGMKETCLNCGKKTCNLAGVGNKARINVNNGCWIFSMFEINKFKKQFK